MKNGYVIVVCLALIAGITNCEFFWPGEIEVVAGVCQDNLATGMIGEN